MCHDYVKLLIEQTTSQFKLPIRHNIKVDELKRASDSYGIDADVSTFHARNVIVAAGPYRTPYIPSFNELDRSILQLHSSSYCNPTQIPVNSILVVGAGNSGAEIALDLV